MGKIKISFDGSCRPINPGGQCTAASVIERDGRVIKMMSRIVGNGPSMSNNVGEYHGLKDALLFLKDMGCTKDEIQVFGDSMMVIQQMKGNWKIKGGLYKSVALETKKLVAEFQDISFFWVPRAENSIADALTAA